MPHNEDAEDNHIKLLGHINRRLVEGGRPSTLNLYYWIAEFLQGPELKTDFGIPRLSDVTSLTLTENSLIFSFGSGRHSRDSIINFFKRINENILSNGLIGFELSIAEGVEPILIDPYPVEAQMQAGELKLSEGGSVEYPVPKGTHTPSFHCIPKEERKMAMHLAYAPDAHQATGGANIFLGIDNVTPSFLHISSGKAVTRYGLNNAACHELLQADFQGIWVDNLPEGMRQNLNPDSYCQALYVVDLDTGKFATHLLLLDAPGRSFGGVGRADKVESCEYYWNIARGDSVNDPILRNLTAKLAEDRRKDREEGFSRCNTPTSIDSAVPPFEIRYFRRTRAGKVAKSCTKNTPRAELLSLPRSMAEAADYNFFQTIAHKVADKGAGRRDERTGRRAVKSKGAMLGVSRGRRLGAGMIMKGVTAEPSATKFLYEGVLGNPAREDSGGASMQVSSGNPPEQGTTLARNSFVNLKHLSNVAEIESTPRVNQEWCHLLGHGDGGGEWVGNFVCGSYHCNTEQLAIESAIRRFSWHNPGMFMLHSTAYLLPNGGFEGAAEYLNVLRNHRGVRHPTTGEEIHERTNVGDNTAPIAAFIRYKISVGTGFHSFPPSNQPQTAGSSSQPDQPAPPRRRTSEGRRIIFDYIFEGQSEFFDVNQYHIVYYTVLAAVRDFARSTRGGLVESSGQSEAEIVRAINEALQRPPTGWGGGRSPANRRPPDGGWGGSQGRGGGQGRGWRADGGWGGSQGPGGGRGRS